MRPSADSKDGVLCRLYSSGSKLSEGAVMAADASLPLERISGALHAMFDMLSKPDTLPELTSLQVSISLSLLDYPYLYCCLHLLSKPSCSA